jgi:broad specificity phosphatase PhoE
LTETGRRQAAEAGYRVGTLHPMALLSSPMTRALETAAIVGRRIGLDPVVEVELREWLPDRDMRWSTAAQVEATYEAMLEAPDLPSPPWETMDELRHRAWGALRPYFDCAGPVIAVCHEVLIHALTGEPRTEPCALRPIAP